MGTGTSMICALLDGYHKLNKMAVAMKAGLNSKTPIAYNCFRRIWKSFLFYFVRLCERILQ